MFSWYVAHVFSKWLLNSPRGPCVLLLLVSPLFIIIIIIIIIIIYAIVPNTCPHHLGSNLAPRTHHVMA
jgi:uncharacterized membrane protein